MGFGIGVGPRIFRVRVSTRGVGLSSGVGPFSVYANTSGGRRRRRSSSTRVSTSPLPAPHYGNTTTTNLIGASADQLAPTGAGELVAQLNRAESWLSLWRWIGIVSLALAFVSVWFLIPAVLAVVVGHIGFSSRRVLLDYEVDSALTAWFEGLVAGWPSVSSTRGKWRTQTSTHLHHTYDRKVNAGVTNVVNRHGVTAPLKPPMSLKTNLQVPTIKARTHSLSFLPDRILVKSGKRWSDVDYRDMHVVVAQRQFVESGMASVPRDGQRIGETWQYANVKGGPDRRFKNNKRLPIMLYSYVALTSRGGLGWEVCLSRHDVATWWQQALRVRPATPPLTSPLPPEVAPVAVPQTVASNKGDRPNVFHSPGDAPYFDYRVSVPVMLDALTKVHAMGGGGGPEIENSDRLRVTLAPGWIEEYADLKTIVADLERVKVGAATVTRVHWSTHSTATPETQEKAAEDGHKAAQRANDLLAQLLGQGGHPS